MTVDVSGLVVTVIAHEPPPWLHRRTILRLRVDSCATTGWTVGDPAEDVRARPEGVLRAVAQDQRTLSQVASMPGAMRDR